MSLFQHQRAYHRILKFLLIALLVLLRVIHLDSDAYARLSWSSALLTDEGFYLHNARNLVLFGHMRTDDFNNALIMPLLHIVQVAVFTLCGVGAMQSRSISVVSSLLTLLVFFAALRRAFGVRVAWLGLVLLGLDPVFVLYNRLALMDTPACLPLVCAFYAWTVAHRKKEEKEKIEGDKETRRKGDKENKPQNNSEGRAAEPARKQTDTVAYFASPCLLFSLSPCLPLFLCGLCLGAAYATRGLAAIVVPVPFLLLLWRTRVRGGFQLLIPSLLPILACLSGLACALLPYLLFWYLPRHAELARVNAYYLNHQLKPDSLRHLWQNIQHAFFGDDRGFAPYLFRHSPLTFALTLLWLITPRKEEKEKRRKGEKESLSTINYQLSTFLALWLLLTWLLLAVISYAPDRYYVLFYPAMCGLAALALCELPQRIEALWQSPIKRTLLGGFLAYHLGEAFLHHQSAVSEICLTAFTAGTLLALAIVPGNMSQWRERWLEKASVAVKVCLLLWALVAGGWTVDWLRHLEYTQRDADRWLATHLPPNSVLIGDVAPGLCLNNRFRCVNVIPGLCNDKQPIESFAPNPRYIIILDGKFKELWWRNNYPQLVAPGHQIHEFPRIIRLTVAVYQVSGFRFQGTGSH